MKYLLLICILPIISASYGQKDKKEKEKDKEKLMSMREEWFEGSIMTNEGEELKGLVWYNDNNGVLSFRDGSQARVFTARSVSGFEVFDENQRKQRLYFSLEYDDPDYQSGVRPYFFEVVKDFKSFAVLAKSNPVEIQTKSNNSGYYTPTPGMIAPGGNYTEVSQTETIFFLNGKGKIEPYLKVVKKEFLGRYFWDETREKNKLVDPSLLSEYISKPVYEKLEAYAKANDLKFRNKEDFLQILEYYAQNFVAR
jgi:hypothetical protein